MHSFERFLTGFIAEGGGFVATSGLAGTAAGGALSGIVPAAVGVNGLASGGSANSPPPQYGLSSSWDFELSEEMVTPEEGRSVGVGCC